MDIITIHITLLLSLGLIIIFTAEAYMEAARFSGETKHAENFMHIRDIFIAGYAGVVINMTGLRIEILILFLSYTAYRFAFFNLFIFHIWKQLDKNNKNITYYGTTKWSDMQRQKAYNFFGDVYKGIEWVVGVFVGFVVTNEFVWMTELYKKL